jgi:hypothetical protein
MVCVVLSESFGDVCDESFGDVWGESFVDVCYKSFEEKFIWRSDLGGGLVALQEKRLYVN